MNDKFLQPTDAIKVVSRIGGPRTLLTPEALQAARDRVARGEDLGKVSAELAIDMVAMNEGLSR
jgi:hypothetical protein